MPDSGPAKTCDVTILGGGLAGKAAALHLAKAGLHVVCIDPAEPTRPPVGESLDWSSPELLKTLGFPMHQVIATQLGTWKNHVILKLPSGAAEDYVPVPWLAKPPYRVELRTLHIDRFRLDSELLQKVLDSGITLVRDKVARIDRAGDRISAVHTASGQQFTSPFFIDASGFAASLFAREFNLPASYNGPQKVALWTYFDVKDAIDGTTLYMSPRPDEYLDWIWEIPIKPGAVGVGYITTAEDMKAKRHQGASVTEIFRRQLLQFPRFAPLLESNPLEEPSVTTFCGRTHRDVAGPNWLIVGEAASMVDPITANGVTASLRHASEAVALLLKYFKRGHLPFLARKCYSFRVRQVAKFFNSGIENIVFQPPVRNRFGLRHCGTLYISPAWTMNLVYARTKPTGIISTLLISAVLGLFRLSEWFLYRLCRLFPARTPAQC
jgi:menaquinone-9 beta-reductase